MNTFRFRFDRINHPVTRRDKHIYWFTFVDKHNRPVVLSRPFAMAMQKSIPENWRLLYVRSDPSQGFFEVTASPVEEEDKAKFDEAVCNHVHMLCDIMLLNYFKPLLGHVAFDDLLERL